MIFYDCSTAPSPRRARMFIAEKGLDIDTRDISIARGEQLSPEFLAVNPGATVPVLVTEDGLMLNENIGIATYLEARFPEPPLMGTTPEEKGMIATWNAICEQQMGLAVAEALRNSSPRMQGRALPGQRNYDQIPELAERGFARIAAFYDLLERRLGDSAFLATDQFTLADITGYVLVDFARVVRQPIPEGNSATRAWFDAIQQRPSAAL